MTKAMLKAKREDPNRAAVEAEKGKEKKEGGRCEEVVGVKYLPMAVDTFGGFGPNAIGALERVANEMRVAKDMEAQVSSKRLAQKLRVVVMSHVATEILWRSKFSHGEEEMQQEVGEALTKELNRYGERQVSDKEEEKMEEEEQRLQEEKELESEEKKVKGEKERKEKEQKKKERVRQEKEKEEERVKEKEKVQKEKMEQKERKEREAKKEQARKEKEKEAEKEKMKKEAEEKERVQKEEREQKEKVQREKERVQKLEKEQKEKVRQEKKREEEKEQAREKEKQKEMETEKKKKKEIEQERAQKEKEKKKEQKEKARQEKEEKEQARKEKEAERVMEKEREKQRQKQKEREKKIEKVRRGKSKEEKRKEQERAKQTEEEKKEEKEKEEKQKAEKENEKQKERENEERKEKNDEESGVATTELTEQKKGNTKENEEATQKRVPTVLGKKGKWEEWRKQTRPEGAISELKSTLCQLAKEEGLEVFDAGQGRGGECQYLAILCTVDPTSFTMRGRRFEWNYKVVDRFRAKIAAWLRSHGDKWIGGETVRSLALMERGRWKEGMSVRAEQFEWEKYLRGVAQARFGQWGDNFTIMAASGVLKRVVVVRSVGPSRTLPLFEIEPPDHLGEGESSGIPLVLGHLCDYHYLPVRVKRDGPWGWVFDDDPPGGQGPSD